MKRNAVFFTNTLLLLSSVPATVAHGHDESNMGMGQGSNNTMGMASGLPLADPSYFSLGEHASAMSAHIIFMLIAWCGVLPIAVVLSIARSRFTLPTQCAFLLTNAFGLLTGMIYNHKTPDLYENNIHHTAGWAITFVAIGWFIMTIIKAYTGGPPKPSARSVTVEAMVEHNQQNYIDRRWSTDSGQGTERNTESLCDSPPAMSLTPDERVAPAWKSTHHNIHDDDLDAGHDDVEKRGFLHNTSVDRFLSRTFSGAIFGRTQTVLNIVRIIVERLMLLMGFVAIMSGMVVFGGVFRGTSIFNGMAHFVKGGIFFWYGLLTFGRWMGCFSEFGWAWNIKPGAELVGSRASRIPSAEFTESFVIWFYGASNVFLEHLAAWGNAWTPMDLEHLSITIMFFGGGLLGMLVESEKTRHFLNTALFHSNRFTTHAGPEWQEPKSYVHPLNPLPALIIMLLGVTMSSHTQHSMASASIHAQWGKLFVGFALARGLTYITFWLKPPKSYLPSRPPSEIVAAFCLVSGGAIFMASNRDTVQALERYNVDSLFVFTVMMGMTALLMAWTMIVMAIKGWATKHEQKRSMHGFNRGIAV